MSEKIKHEPASLSIFPKIAYTIIHNTAESKMVRRIFTDPDHTTLVDVVSRPFLENGVMVAKRYNDNGQVEIYHLTKSAEGKIYWEKVKTMSKEEYFA